MKVLLIYPQYSLGTKFDSRMPSLSLLYLASMLERYGHEVTIYDASIGPIIKIGKVFHYGVSDEEIREFLRNQSFDIVGITCSFAARWRYVDRIAQLVKEADSRIPVAIGGLYPTYNWKYCLKNYNAIDFVMLGEAELSFADIVNNISNGFNISDSCKKVEGVAWRERGNKIFYNPKLKYNDKLDDLPFPAWHLVELNKYFAVNKNLFEIRPPYLLILSSRSCPNRCRFCNMYLTHGSVWRYRSAKNVVDEIEYLIKNFSVRNFCFMDDNFSLNPNRAKEICREIIERKLNIRYNFPNGVSIKTFDYELVNLMKKSGCTSVCLAIESGSERIRNEVYGKKLSTQKIFEVVNLFYKEGIPAIGYFMLGAPTESKYDFKKTAELIAKLPLSYIAISIFTPYPMTELYDECETRGWLCEYSADNKERLELYSPMLKTPDFKPRDIGFWQMKLYFYFILNHWPTVVKEILRPGGVIKFNIFEKVTELMRFRFSKILTNL